MTRNKHRSAFRTYYGILLCVVLHAGFSSVFAQSSSPDNITNAFNRYRSEYLQERLYLHTDKNSYLPREICWFRIYYTDALFNRPASLSKLAYVEILDKNNRALLQEKISLKKGESNGSLVIPVNIPSGTYKIRAYTSWMKNFSPGYFFEKAIRIINPVNLQPDSAISKLKGYDVQFFPEGGNLVSQTESKVGFRVTDAYGRGQLYEGVLLNSNNEVVLRFHPLHKGLGHFVFTPVSGQKYKSIIRFTNGDSVLRELPPVYTEGYAMALSAAASQISVIVRTTDGMESQPVYLLIHGQYHNIPVKQGKIEAHTATFKVEAGELEDGISQFTVFTKDEKPVCERLYFKYPQQKLLLSAEVNNEYATRKKIDIQLSASDQHGNPALADMSLAVYRLDSLQGTDENNITNYSYLTSELGPVESPGYYFEENGKGREEDMDNLMLTQGWRRFNWQNILQPGSTRIEFAPEYQGHIIQGKVVNNKTNLPVPQTDVFLSVPSVRTQFRNTTSDSAGRIRFELKGFYGSRELIVQTNPLMDSSARVEIDNPFSQKFSKFNPPDFTIPALNSADLLNQSIHEQVQHAYDLNQMNQAMLQWVDTVPFYSVADERYMLDDYTRFQTMEEVLREYVHSMNVIRRKDQFEIILFNNPFNKYFTDQPLMLIDGVPVFYANQIMRQDPLKIKRIDLVNKPYALGYLTFSGILNLTTYHGDLDGVELDPHVTVLDYPGISAEREFFAPVYETEKQITSRMPDYRTLLYWAPEIEAGKTGKTQLSFFTSDLPGKYVVVVQGLSDQGIPGTNELFFNVKK